MALFYQNQKIIPSALLCTASDRPEKVVFGKRQLFVIDIEKCGISNLSKVKPKFYRFEDAILLREA